MDWKKIKSILILALIGINLLLAWTLYADNKKAKIDELDRHQIISLLNDKSVTVSPHLLDIDIHIDNISLNIEEYDAEHVSHVFDLYDDNNESGIVSKPFDATKKNEIVFETEYTDLKSTYLSNEDITTQAYTLIDELGISRDDVYLNDIGHTGKKTILSFGQVHNGYIVKDAYMVIKYNNESLLSFNRAWYDVIDIKVNKSDFISPEYALYEFVGQLYDRFPNRNRSLEVKSIQLVYQLPVNTGTSNKFADEGDPNIFWEIITSDEESYLIEANR